MVSVGGGKISPLQSPIPDQPTRKKGQRAPKEFLGRRLFFSGTFPQNVGKPRNALLSNIVGHQIYTQNTVVAHAICCVI